MNGIAVNTRKRTAHPILRDYMALVKSLAGVLDQLGLERKARELPSLEAYLAARSGTAAQAAPQPAEDAAVEAEAPAPPSE